MKKILQYLGSLKLSFFLLVILFGVIIQRAIIAQRYFLSPDPDQVPLFIRWFDFLGLRSVEQLNRIFWCVLVFLAVNLFFSVSRMIRAGRARRKTFKRFKTVQSIEKLANIRVIDTAEFSSARAKDFFTRKGFKVFEESISGLPRMYAVKRDKGQWGIVVFHLTFFLLFLGGITSYLTRFTGYLELAPGETFVEHFDNYLQKTPRSIVAADDIGFALNLKRIDLSYWKPGEVRQRAAVLETIDSGGVSLGSRQISVNNPLRIDGVKIYQGSRHGFIAGVTVTDRAGTTARGTVHFLLAKQKGPELLSWAHLPGTTLDLKFELYSDLVRNIEGLEDFYSSPFKGSMMKISSVEMGGEPVFHGVVFGGGTMEFEGLDLKFESLKPFTSFIVARDYGVPFIYAGFVLLLLSLCMTYFWVPERYWLSALKKGDGFRVYVGGTVDKYKESFREHFPVIMDEFEMEIGS